MREEELRARSKLKGRVTKQRVMDTVAENGPETVQAFLAKMKHEALLLKMMKESGEAGDDTLHGGEGGTVIGSPYTAPSSPLTSGRPGSFLRPYSGFDSFVAGGL
jgi:hypothetical protein